MWTWTIIELDFLKLFGALVDAVQRFIDAAFDRAEPDFLHAEFPGAGTLNDVGHRSFSVHSRNELKRGR